MIIVPANWPAKRRDHWRTLLRARAIENQVYILAVNCVGEIGGISYTGDSCVIGPDGDARAELSGTEGMIVWELSDDVERLRRISGKEGQERDVLRGAAERSRRERGFGMRGNAG